MAFYVKHSHFLYDLIGNNFSQSISGFEKKKPEWNAWMIFANVTLISLTENVHNLTGVAPHATRWATYSAHVQWEQLQCEWNSHSMKSLGNISLTKTALYQHVKRNVLVLATIRYRGLQKQMCQLELAHIAGKDIDNLQRESSAGSI